MKNWKKLFPYLYCENVRSNSSTVRRRNFNDYWKLSNAFTIYMKKRPFSCVVSMRRKNLNTFSIIFAFFLIRQSNCHSKARVFPPFDGFPFFLRIIILAPVTKTKTFVTVIPFYIGRKKVIRLKRDEYLARDTFLIS